MTQIKTLCTLFIVLCLFLSNQTAWGTKHAVILCGSGGEEPYREKFEEWGRRLYDALLKTNGFSPQNIVLFTEAESEAHCAPPRKIFKPFFMTLMRKLQPTIFYLSL